MSWPQDRSCLRDVRGGSAVGSDAVGTQFRQACPTSSGAPPAICPVCSYILQVALDLLVLVHRFKGKAALYLVTLAVAEPFHVLALDAEYTVHLSRTPMTRATILGGYVGVSPDVRDQLLK